VQHTSLTVWVDRSDDIAGKGIIVNWILHRILKPLANQWQVKLYILLLACLLWIFVVNNQTFEDTFSIPIESVNIAPGKILMSDIPDEALVRFSGKGKDLLVMKFIQSPRLLLDLSNINYFYNYPLQKTNVHVPLGIESVAEHVIMPDTVRIILEDVIAESVRVVPNVAVSTEAGFTLVGEITTLPRIIEVSGPKSLVRGLREIGTEERIFPDLTNSLDEVIPILLTDPERMTATPASVRLIVEVDRYSERRLERIPVGAIKVPRGRQVSVEPSVIDVILRGPMRRLATQSEDSIDAFVNIALWEPTQREYSPEFNLPDGIEVIRVEPERVRVRVEIR